MRVIDCFGFGRQQEETVEAFIDEAEEREKRKSSAHWDSLENTTCSTMCMNIGNDEFDEGKKLNRKKKQQTNKQLRGWRTVCVCVAMTFRLPSN